MSNLDQVLSDFKAGKFIVVTDDENRENEADLILLAEKSTPENIGFMVRYTSGVICGVITAETAKRLKLPLMVKRNEDNLTTAFTVTVDAIAGRSTGIPAEERANTLRALADINSQPTDFARPGHVFPLISVAGGLHERRGHTEASIALCELSGSNSAAVLSELVNDDGSMMRGAQITDFANQHGLQVISIEELAENPFFADENYSPHYMNESSREGSSVDRSSIRSTHKYRSNSNGLSANRARGNSSLTNSNSSSFNLTILFFIIVWFFIFVRTAFPTFI
jgi:3,4-dihydroxy-2-butanone 4-phosphate synthase